MLHFKIIFFSINLFFLVFSLYSEDRETLYILSENGKIKFNIEIMKTKKDRSKGLMFRKNLSENEGMLFVFPSEQYIKIWMKNTFIPLDIIFISDDKDIVDLKKNAKKLSRAIITSKVKAKYALEINAGLINKLNIKIKDKIYFYE